MEPQAATFSLLCCLLSLGATAATWTIYPSDRNGMTPSQQLTNAVTRAVDGDTVVLEPGVYQLDGASFMGTATASGITSRYYVHLPNKRIDFVGNTSGAWNDAVVLKGNGNDRFAYLEYEGSAFRNITFENFAANDHPDQKANNNNIDNIGLGGAIAFSIYNKIESTAVSNCVFRGNVARGGGAISRVWATDCLFTNNVAHWGGGAVYGSRMTRCRCVDNKAINGGIGGAACWPNKLSECTFSGNSSSSSAGAVTGDENMLVEDCTFLDNAASAEGGAMTLRRKTSVVRCIFSGNSSAKQGGAISSSDQSGANGGAGSVFADCTFSSNASRTTGGAVYAGVPDSNGPIQFRSCTFIGNRANTEYFATYGAAYSNCTFRGNIANGSYGIVGGPSDGLVPIVDCVFSNNYSFSGGMVRYAYCTNTLFTCNEVPRVGGVVKRCRAVDCRFVGNRKYDTLCGIATNDGTGGTPMANSPSGDATESTLEKCDLDLGCILNCVLVDCHIHTLTNKGAYCVFYGHNVATNCLIEDCAPPDQLRGLVYRWGSVETAYVTGSDYVNCTFAGNTFPRIYSHQQEYGIYTPFKNCLFYNNRDNWQNLIDAVYKVKDSHGDLTNLDSGFALSNCVFGAIGSQIAGDTWHDLGGNRLVAPEDLKVAGAKAALLGVHKYALCAESPALGMGDARMFSATDLDYAGNLRLRDGRLDPGCFECWLNIMGTRIVFR